MDQFQGMAEMFKKAAEANPEMMGELEQLEKISEPFLDEYPLDVPEIMSQVDDQLDPASKDFFILYTKLLKSYASDSGSRFILDFFCYGSDRFEMFVSEINKPQIIKSLLLRGSQIRLMSHKMSDMSSSDFMKVYGKTIETWGLSDTLELKYGSFLPVSVSELLVELQMEASK